ncbi:IS200/IS605 family element RNA-guided endonuclease TnpB [Geomicrobium sp. JCM 19039]|uniref:IS200/IS605 family element RNA-guided endonuclease TnpB n=1 Tax=Geomicrobium sp. JCM 19039 TaxID=1460636 RepID=UPI00045F207D|nr:IS200/IS605 family element RNA-guided endonuclease TnpB [Geomicrobium sp. JCM 19039]GAK10434.1 mobile element protein [Geomicrobium sp. JCM 19039]
MLTYKGIQFRLYPNLKQQEQIAQTIGCCRFVYNHFRASWEHTYTETGKGLTYKACANALPLLKGDVPFLKDVDSTALQKSVWSLADAYRRFYAKLGKYPRFKSKRNPVQSYTTAIQGKAQVFTNTVTNNRIKLPKLGWVKIRGSRVIEGRIIAATITRKASGRYLVSLKVEADVQPLPSTGQSVGVDLGITNFAILSSGEKMDNHRFTKAMRQKLAREQRKLSRRAEGAKRRGTPLHLAKNYEKQKRVVARLHEKVANQRKDFLHKRSTDLIKNHDRIVVEDLHAKGMLRNRKLASAISDVSWSMFVTQLTYKADWYGKQFIKVDRWFPSSQLCSSCGHHDGKKGLHVREWSCSACHTSHDRDINAAKNILQEGLRTAGAAGIA